MKNNKLVRFVQSLILLPVMTIGGVPAGLITPALNIASSPHIAFLQKFNKGGVNAAPNQSVDPEALARKAKAEAIDAYFGERDMPLAGTGMKMVEEAEKNGLDWRLLPAIAIRESTGGKNACKKTDYSAFGWGSCKINFKSNEHAIEIVAQNLGGNNPNTAKHYGDKTTVQILRAYNPPSIVPRYAEQVMGIMDKIGEQNIELELALNS